MQDEFQIFSRGNFLVLMPWQRCQFNKVAGDELSRNIWQRCRAPDVQKSLNIITKKIVILMNLVFDEKIKSDAR